LGSFGIAGHGARGTGTGSRGVGMDEAGVARGSMAGPS
jgi:hypothetical protein